MKNDDFTISGKETAGEVSRRNFLKFCGMMAVSMGLPAAFGENIAAAAAKAKQRPPVIWLHGQECTGCTESLLRSTHPTVENLILDLISLDYHETLNAGAGKQAENALRQSMSDNKGKYILVVEGATPVKDGGIYCKVGGRPFIDILKEAGSQAAAVIAIGSCAAWGGIQSAAPNPTGAMGTQEVLKNKTVVNIPGCPPNAYNFLSTVLHFLTFKKLPALDALNRPVFAYGKLIHENCERRAHFDAGRFAERFGDEAHRNGYCLYKLGCKGPLTHANCPSILFCDAGSGAWPVGTGHPCFGCTEKAVGFTMPIHSLADIPLVTPSANHSQVGSNKGKGVTAGAVGVLGGVAGAAVGVTAVLSKNLGDTEKGE
jgi:hydrogenase small subunit